MLRIYDLNDKIKTMCSLLNKDKYMQTRTKTSIDLHFWREREWERKKKRERGSEITVFC